MKILITGTAGFIGYHLTKRLCERGDEVVGFDSINDYYDVAVKYGRLAQLGFQRDAIVRGSCVRSSTHTNLQFFHGDLEDAEAVRRLFAVESFDRVVNLAAQAGVRYSLEHPEVYINSNIVGYLNVLEACRHNNVEHLVYASSSSVYGMNTVQPFSTSHNVDHPISLYAASKKSNELMAHTYSHLFGLPTTGLRFFTVYGPWGRPDMALFLFTKAILEDREIDVFNHGKMKRDFTYIDDIIEGVVRVIDSPPKGRNDWDPANPDPGSSSAPFKVYNIGNNNPVELMDFIHEIETQLGRTAKKRMLPMQAGDVPSSHADVTDLIEDLGYRPNTPVSEGIRRFVEWYKDFFKVD
jgi:UDP-glucuronate 4-epimerase